MADTWLDTLKSGFGFFGPRAIPQPAPMQPGTSTNPMNAYFTQLADPRYRKAMQSQNLFSNLLNFGAQMSAAGAPSLDPGYAGRTRAGALAGLGKGLMSGNQAYRDQMMNAIKLKSMMDLNALKKAEVQSKLNARKKFQNMVSGMTPTTATTPQTAGEAYADEHPTEPVVTPSTNDVRVGKFGFVMTPDRINTLSLVNDADKASELFTEFRKRDDELIKDARNRLKPTLNSLNETIVKIDKVNQAVLLANGTADLAAINSYQRLIDEGVVRGEDVALQAKASPLYGRLKLLADNVRKGDLLTPELRKRMAETSNVLGRTVYDNANTRIGYQKMLAQKNNVPWARVYAGDELYEKYLTPASSAPQKKPTLENLNLRGLGGTGT
jgi:hypothetical protein